MLLPKKCARPAGDPSPRLETSNFRRYTISIAQFGEKWYPVASESGFFTGQKGSLYAPNQKTLGQGECLP